MTLTYDNTIARRDETSRMVRDAQRGERAAFGQLFEQYREMVYATALRRLRDPLEAEELCQEVFVQAMRKIGQLREPAAVGGWLRQVAIHMAINRATRKGPMVATEPQTLESITIEYRTAEHELIETERRAQVRAGMSRLRELDRRTLEAFYFNGHSLVEMSDEFDSPVGTIKRRLHVARKRLAEELDELVAV